MVGTQRCFKATNACSGFRCSETVLQLRPRSSADGCSLQGKDMQRKDTRQMLWDRNTSEFSSWDGCKGYWGWGTRQEWQDRSRRRGRKKVRERYLLNSLSPSQPHRFLMTAFVSLMGSLAHLQIWRQLGTFNTSRRVHEIVCVCTLESGGEWNETKGSESVNLQRLGLRNRRSAKGQINAQTYVKTSPFPQLERGAFLCNLDIMVVSCTWLEYWILFN